MSLKVEPLAIAGVLLVTPRRFADSRGYFVETYTQRTFHQAGITAEFRQDNQSPLDPTRHHPRPAFPTRARTDRRPSSCACSPARSTTSPWTCAAGSVTYGRWCGATLTARAGEELLIPIGFAHAFCTLEPDTIVAYKVDGFYSKVAEAGLRWDDPDIAIEWPVPAAEIRVSEKDATLPRLSEIATPFDFGS